MPPPERSRPFATAFLPLFLLVLLLPAPSLAVDLFWADSSPANRRIQRCDVASCTPADFATGLASSPSSALALDPIEGMLYWAINSGNAQIQRKDLTGGTVENIFGSMPNTTVTGIAIDPVARHVYVATPSTPVRIRRFSIDSPGDAAVTVLLFNEAGCTCSPEGLALDLAGGYLYWSDSSGGAVRRKALSLASPPEDVVTGLTTPRALSLDVTNDRVYFSQTTPSRISFAALSSPATVLDLVNPLSDQLFAGGLERDAAAGTLGELYFAITGDEEIRHCSIDAGCPSPTLLASGMQDNHGLALLPDGPGPVPALGPFGYLALALMLAGAAARRGWRNRRGG